VYAILAKEIMQHLPREQREGILAAAKAEQTWYMDRLKVLKKIHAPLQRRQGSGYGRKRVEQEQTVLERLAVLRGELSHDFDVYSFEGRLRAIGKVFLQPHGDHAQEEVQDDARSSSTWFMEKVVAEHPDAILPRHGRLLDVKMQDIPDDGQSSIYVPPQDINYKIVARDANTDKRLQLSIDTDCYHFPTLTPEPRGRADGMEPNTSCRKPVDLLEQAKLRSTAAKNAKGNLRALRKKKSCFVGCGKSRA
jgi:hypothetical protein